MFIETPCDCGSFVCLVYFVVPTGFSGGNGPFPLAKISVDECSECGIGI
jgi:hypothetical protein